MDLCVLLLFLLPADIFHGVNSRWKATPKTGSGDGEADINGAGGQCSIRGGFIHNTKHMYMLCLAVVPARQQRWLEESRFPAFCSLFCSALGSF